MSELTDLAKTPGLSEVANNLINKISDVIGWGTISNTKRIAIENYVDDIKNSDLLPMEKAALISNAGKIIKEYTNQTNIIKKAIPLLSDGANPDSVNEDWVLSFMDKAKLISDEEFQLIWAKLLAEETNNYGTISLRTLEVLKNLSRQEALLFQEYAKRAVYDGKQAYIIPPLIGLTEDFSKILMMEDCGLMSSQQIHSTVSIPSEKEIVVLYNTKKCCAMRSIDGSNKFEYNAYLFTRAGYELLQAINIEQDDNVLLNYMRSIKTRYDNKIAISVYEVENISKDYINCNKDIDLLNE